MVPDLVMFSKSWGDKVESARFRSLIRLFQSQLFGKRRVIATLTHFCSVNRRCYASGTWPARPGTLLTLPGAMTYPLL